MLVNTDIYDDALGSGGALLCPQAVAAATSVGVERTVGLASSGISEYQSSKCKRYFIRSP